MIELSIAEVAHAVAGDIHGDAARRIDAVATDSRRLPVGMSLFVALPGVSVDGRDFARAAVDAGAVAVMAATPLPELGVPVIVVDDPWRALLALGSAVRAYVGPTSVAVTGSVGKTTVKDLTAAAVGAGRRVHAASGSFNNELGVPLTLLGLREDTQVLVAEVGARHVGDIAALTPALAPDISIITAVAPVHLEVFGSIEAVARGKRELVEALGPDGMAILNVADPLVAAMGTAAPSMLAVSADDPGADVHAVDIHLDRYARARARAITPWGSTSLVVPIAGRHHITNGLLALAVAGHLGVDLDAAAHAISEARVSPWRSEVFVTGGVTVLNDAYNANPIAVRAALQTLTSIERTGRTVAVLGVMGEIGPTGPAEHEGVGRVCAESGIDLVVVVGAEAAGIAQGARDAGAREVVEVEDAAGATASLRAYLSDGDVVLVKASRVAGLETVAAGLAAGKVAP